MWRPTVRTRFRPVGAGGADANGVPRPDFQDTVTWGDEMLFDGRTAGPVIATQDGGSQANGGGSGQPYGLRIHLTANQTAPVTVYTRAGTSKRIQMNYFGFAAYNESKLGIAYGKKLGNIVDAGIQFDYNFFHISGYGNANAINAEAGIILHPSEKINIGLHIYNPFGGEIGKNKSERMASVFRIGIGYEASQQVCIHVEIIKEENIPVNVNAGLQYAFAKQFFAGIGIETSSGSPYGGAGLHWKNFRIDVEVDYHLQLGFTPAVVFLFQGKNKKQE